MLKTIIMLIVFAFCLNGCTVKTEDQVPKQENFVGSTDEISNPSSDTGDSNAGDEEVIRLKVADDVIVNADGSFRLSEYKEELTRDKIRDRIVFDVQYTNGFEEGVTLITEELLWNLLWDDSNFTEISVKILEGKAKEDVNKEETVLHTFLFYPNDFYGGNLAVVEHEKQSCLMRYGNKMHQGRGTFWYEIWQMMPAGKEPVLLVEKKVDYVAPVSGSNSKETIDLAIQIEEEIDGYLSRSGSKILVNDSTNKELCYLHGSEEGLTNGRRKQDALDVFLAEAWGNGFELKIADYFYPDGMEPISEIPTDAEDSIKDGEILYMRVAPYNTTAGRLDLDGDGTRETIYLEPVESDFHGDGWWSRRNEKGEIDFYGLSARYRIRINDQCYYVEEDYCDSVEALLMAFSPDGEQILLAVYDNGPSGDPLTRFYRYDGADVYPVGRFKDDLRDITIDEDGMMKCGIREDVIQTQFIWAYFYWNGSEIVRREDEIYYFTGDFQQSIENGTPMVLLKEITVYEERSEESQAYIMKPQFVHDVASDMERWILLEALDGTKGWLNIEGMDWEALHELFDGLSAAG